MKYPGIPLTTLNRASRNAPQIGNTAVASQAAGELKSWKATEYTMKAGATPKEITSDSESNSLPNSLVTFKARATRPSRPSVNIATMTSIAAISGSLLKTKIIDTMPRNKLPIVNTFGSDLANMQFHLINYYAHSHRLYVR